MMQTLMRWLTGVMIMSLVACDKPCLHRATGYIESNLVYLSRPYGGLLVELNTKAGQEVVIGEVLLRLDKNPEAQQAKALEAKWQAVDTNLKELKRHKSRYTSAQIKVAEKEQESARAEYEMAKWALTQKTLVSPMHAWVHEIYYEPEEYVLPLRPILSLFSPDLMTGVFFIPARDLSFIKVGASVQVWVGGRSYDATVEAIGDRAIYTPEVMFSEKNVTTLRYLVTLKLSDALRAVVHPGEPIEIDYGPRQALCR